ncbi:MAG: tetratricopeptide repeat protein [bacterium]|nr:tetratricopeptide repeat protein [bacterium]
MSTLNLKQYLAKIDTLLEDEYYDEAIFHSRHILSLLPKNLATYRRLGRAEVGANRWDEAHNTLRRILSFAPDDKMAHMGLSKVYQRAKKPDEALWHLERAYEQDPNNEAIINELRDLYQAYKNISNVRLQLTAGAVGRQYAKNQLYPQAIQVLKNALKQTPQRVDLRLMLARVYRESGDVVAAAETSLDVLDVLPDCLDANYIMTEVWLSEQRPSDAQRYLSVVEALDPYLAIRLAQGHPAPDDLVELPEADYKKIGQTLSDQKPDWLTQIDDGQNPIIELEDENWSAGGVNDPTLRLNTEQLLDIDLDDDDLSWLDEPTSPVSAEETHIPENTRKRSGLTGMLTKFDSENNEQSAVPTEEINFDDLFGADADETPDEPDEVMAWLTDMPSETTDDEEDAIHASDKHDPLGWLKESGIEIVDNNALSTDMLNLTKAPTQALDPNDPMSWLHASGIELTDEPDEDVFTPYEKVDSTILKSADDDDPMAWLRDSGVEMTDETPLQNSFAEDDDSMLVNDADDPMAWMRGSDIEFVEEDETPLPTATTPTGVSSWEDDNSLLDEMLSMEDLTGNTDSLVSALNMPSSATDEDWQDTMLDNSSDDFPDWLSDSQPTSDDDFSFEDTNDEETPDWLMDMKPTEANFDPNATNIAMNFGDMDEEADADETPDWLADMKPTETPVAEDDFDFLSDDTLDEAVAEDTPDWLADMKPAQTPVAEDDFDFLSDDTLDETVAEDETPDWLSGVSASSTEATFDPEATNIGMNFADLKQETDDDFLLDDDELVTEDDTPDWLSGMGTAASIEDDELEKEDTPDWLSGISDPSVEETSEDNFAFTELSNDAVAETDDTPDWLSGVTTASIEDEQPEEEDTPDWLSGISDPSVEETAEDNFAFAELSDENIEADETPDWLSGVGAVASIEDEQPEEEETPDWLSGISTPSTEETTEDDFAFAELSDEDIEADETPDWLSGVGAVASIEDEQPEEEDTPDWLTSMSADDEDESTEEADDAFSFAGLADDEESTEESDDAFSFAELTDEQPDEEETPAWLTSMSADDEDESTEEADDDAFSFAELTDELTEYEEETPDWLTSMKPTEATVEDVEADLDFLSDDLGDDDLITEDAPDWLMDARPQEETDRDLDWLAEEDDEKSPVAEETPSWLSGLGDDDDQISEEESTTWFTEEEAPVGEFDETVPVLAGIATSGLGDEVTSLHTPAENAPDWLNALVPGLDIDYDADEDAQVEQSFLSEEAIATASAKFAWLNKIVEAEVNLPPMTMPSATTIVKPEAPKPTTTSAPKRTWAFSRPPAWLGKSQPPSTGIKPISQVQNTPSPTATSNGSNDDDDDDDLPDWLRDDNGDEPDFLRDNF